MNKEIENFQQCSAVFGLRCILKAGHGGMHAAMLGGEYTNWDDRYAKANPDVGERFAGHG